MKPWADTSLNFIVDLPQYRRTPLSKKKNALLIVVDRFIKIVSDFVVTHKIDAPSLAEVLALKLVLKGTEFPESIVMDRNPQLT